MFTAFREILTYLTAAPAQPKAVSVLPPPPVKQLKTKVRAVDPLLSQIDEDVTYNERGAAISGTIAWEDNAAIRQKMGAIEQLTAYDIATLKEAEQWPISPNTERGRTSIERTKKAKKMWYNGSDKQDVMAALGMSESWVEKRGTAFATALSQEIADGGQKGAY